MTPAPPLDSMIESLWDCEMPALPDRLERMLPVPNTSLVINLAEDQTRVYADDTVRRCEYASGSVFEGPSTHSFLIDTVEQQRVMGVIFRPGGVGPIIRERIDVFSNRNIDLEDLAGAEARRLRQRLLETAIPAERLRVLEDWLRARLSPARTPPLVAQALHEIGRSPQTARIGSVIADCGVSARRFGQIFRQHVGIGPKRYARLLRFRVVVNDVHRHKDIDWARVAADCGFYDQPHLTREFRAFSGMTPTTYLARKGPFANHVPLD